jgi:hypothetical protein
MILSRIVIILIGTETPAATSTSVKSLIVATGNMYFGFVFKFAFVRFFPLGLPVPLYPEVAVLRMSLAFAVH